MIDSAKQPLFFGGGTGLTDEFNAPHPEILEADEKQRSLFWPATEISFYRDSQDLANFNHTERELMIRALSMQLAGDSAANGTIQQLFLPIISNSQAKGLISYWGDSESVHDRTYARIVAQCFKDPTELFDRVRTDERLLKRLTPILTQFGEQIKMNAQLDLGYDIPQDEKERMISKTIVTLLALEGIMFITSFATTFAVCESTNRCNGVAKAVGLISDDESGSHVRNNLLFLDIIVNKEKYACWQVPSFVKEMQGILDTVMDLEHEWAGQLFEGLDSIVGFNEKLVIDYSCYLARPIYLRCGLEYKYKVVMSNPIPWINSYITPDLLQTAAQESQVTNYKINAVVDDTSDMSFDDENFFL